MHLDRINVTLPAGAIDCPLPRMMPVEQRFPREAIDDVEAAVRATLGALERPDVAGKRIAITAGSRGIPMIVEVLRAVIAQLRDWGAEPFVIPAMGSHGGGTAEGQEGVLAGYGITEAGVGAPIHSSMEVVQTTEIENGIPLFCDKFAYEADGIAVINKIKPHSSYKGDYESGLCKMLVIGLGKHHGAAMFHSLGFARFADIVPKAAAAQLTQLPVVFAVGLVENAYDGLAVIEAMPAERLVAREKELLAHAKQIMGKFLMSGIDVLIVDEFGKDISGVGMDPTVTGRAISGLPGFVAPPITRIVVRALSEATHGNATGMGAADIITLRVFNALDLGAVYTNCITSRNLGGGNIPMIANTDKEAISVGVFSCLGIDPAQARIVRIRNTKKLQKISMSEAYLPEIEGDSRFAVQDAPEPLRFDDTGGLID